MATPSAHFNLIKPATTDYYDIAVVNANTDIIDQQLYNNQVSAAKVMVGATAEDDGESGRVPAPQAGDRDKYLKADGTWDTPAGGGGGSNVSITPTLSSGTKIADYEIDGISGELYAPDAGSSTRKYLGQLIERVSSADGHITSSGKTTYSGGDNWHAFDGNETTSGIAYCWAADENNTSAYIQYHFDSPYYFAQIQLKLYSHYAGAWTGNINILGSNDGDTWTNISSTGQAVSVTAPLNTVNTESIDLDDSETWEYIRVQADGNAFNVADQPCCDFSEIYVYGGKLVQGIDGSIIDFSQITPSQTADIMDKLNSGNGDSDSGTFTTGSAQYEKVEVNCGFRPTYIQVILPFSNGDTTAVYDASVSTTTSTWTIPQERNIYTITLGSTTGETGIVDITDTGFKFRCNAGNTRNVACTYTATAGGETYIQTVDFSDISSSQADDILGKLDFTSLTATQIAKLKTALGIS